MSVPLDLAKFGSALIVKPSSLGDIIHTLPAVHRLKAAHPHLAIRWVANTEWTPLLAENPDLAEVVAFPRNEFRRLSSLPSFVGWLRRLNAGAREIPEVVLDFQGLARSALLSWARGTTPVVGLSDAREGARHVYQHVVPVDRADHSVDRYLSMVHALSVPDDGEVCFPLPAGERPAGVELTGDFIALHPYSRGKGKSLPDDAIQALCQCLSPRQVVILGRVKDREAPRGLNVVSLVNRTSLSELIWVLRRAGGVISADSGPMHIAAAVNDRTAAIHTWSDPAKVGPYNPKALVWKSGRVCPKAEYQPKSNGAAEPFTAASARRLADVIIQSW